jgi:hypothetical protein
MVMSVCAHWELLAAIEEKREGTVISAGSSQRRRERSRTELF